MSCRGKTSCSLCARNKEQSVHGARPICELVDLEIIRDPPSTRKSVTVAPPGDRDPFSTATIDARARDYSIEDSKILDCIKVQILTKHPQFRSILFLDLREELPTFG